MFVLIFGVHILTEYQLSPVIALSTITKKYSLNPDEGPL